MPATNTFVDYLDCPVCLEKTRCYLLGRNCNCEIKIRCDQCYVVRWIPNGSELYNALKVILEKSHDSLRWVE